MHSFRNALGLAFGVAFGLVALAVAYQAVVTNTELRSKAAEEGVIYQSWDFNGKNKEGWSAPGKNKLRVADGRLQLTIADIKTPATLKNNLSSDIDLPRGQKYIKFSAAVNVGQGATPTPKGFGGIIQSETVQEEVGETTEAEDPDFLQAIDNKTVCTMEAKQCADGSYVGRGGDSCQFLPCPSQESTKPEKRKPEKRTISGLVYYKLRNHSKWEKPLRFTLLANGKLNNTVVALPEIDTVQLAKLRISFIAGLSPGDTVSVDWVRVVGKELPKPTLIPLSPMPTAIEMIDCDSGVCPSGYQCVKPGPCPSGKVCAFRPYCSPTSTPRLLME